MGTSRRPARPPRAVGRRGAGREPEAEASESTDELREKLRASEEALAVAERRFLHTVERIADGILVVDLEGTIRFTNRAAERIFRRSAAQLVGIDLGVPLISGETTQIDLVGPMTAHVAELRVADTVWEDEPALLVSVRDITERRDAEERARHLISEQLRRQQAEATASRSRLLAEASHVMSSSLDERRSMEALVRLIAASLGDHCVVELFGGADHGALLRLAASRRPDGSAEIVHHTELARAHGPRPASLLEGRASQERRVERIDATDHGWLDQTGVGDEERELWRRLRPATVIVAPLVSATARLGLLAVISSDRAHQFDEQDEALVGELAYRANVALENARLLRMAQGGSRAKSDFLAVISHELRTPLTGIMGYAGLLVEEVERPLLPNEHRYVEGILRSADRLLRVIDQILLFASSRSEGDEIRYRTLPLSELLDDVVSVVRPLAVEAGLELTMTAPGRDVMIATDVQMTRHILLHLLTNAIKFTERGSVRLEAAATVGALRLAVSDTGRGIPRDKLDQIFEPFRQADDPDTRAVGGTGIGLNVVQNLVRLLGGRLEIESEVGRGSTFTVILPQPEAEDVPTSATQA